MTLTCVTATFNCVKAGNRERLIRCVESVAKLQTEHEHLIYDGASTDGTVELLRELEAKTPGLKVVSEPDTGIYNALNKGVRDAQGKWFYVLGADDFICHPEVMDEIIKKEAEATQIIIASVTTETPDGKPSKILFSTMEELAGFLNGCVCCHQGEIMKTALVRELHGFDEQYKVSADTDLLLRAHIKAVPMHYLFTPFACFHHGGFADSNTSTFKVEDYTCISRALGLSPRQYKYFSKTNHLPISVAKRLLSHEDEAIRIATRHMLIKCMKYYLRIVLYPIVWATRPLRYRQL